jgi:PAP2 superfamily protein
MGDTVSDVLDLDSGLVVRLYNPIAAFPSIHLAFAVVTAAGLRERARSRLVRRAARAYPPTVFATVVATGNHYVLDGIAGSALAAVALRLSRALDG